MKGSQISLEIDGQKVVAREGMTILEVARDMGIEVPTLCHHEALSPYGACRLCTVEIERNGSTRMVTSCNYMAADGLVVRTNSPKVRKLRKGILELLLPVAPCRAIQELAEEYGAQRSRFVADEATYCVLCGLCVRYCAEVRQVHAIGFVGRGTERRVAFFPEIAQQECMSCRECFGLCPTGKLAAETDGVCFDGISIDDILMVPEPAAKEGGLATLKT